MKKLVALFCCIFPLLLSAQKLNKAGHIVLPESNFDYAVGMVNNAFEIDFQYKKFKGNALFETANGFLSVDGNYENGISQLYGYTENGKEVFHKKYNQTINIKLSEDKNFAAFYNRGVVVVLNLSSFEEQAYPASALFVVHNNGTLSYVNTVDNTMHSNGLSEHSSSLVVDVIQKNNTPYFIAKNKIYALAKNEIKEIYNSSKSIFEVKKMNDVFYISEKESSNTEYIFNLISTRTFSDWNTLQSVSYPRIIAAQAKSIKHKNEKFNTLDNESFLNPVDFTNDSSYQAIGNSYNEIQEYSQGDTYLHPGVDLFGVNLQNVHSVKKGFIKAILTTSGAYHWRIAIANQNTSDSSQGYLYAHLDANLIPVGVGDSVLEGEVIGQLVDFPVTGFVHCHFARIVDAGSQWNGSWWTFDNPLYYMENFVDTTAPVFEEVLPGFKFAFRDELTKDYFPGDVVFGKVDIVSKVYDQINTFWQVDVHKTGFKISTASKPDSILYAKESFNFNMFNDTYFSGPYIQDIINTMYARDATCMSTGNYNDRIFYHVLTNSNGDDTITLSDESENFNTKLYVDGEYRLTVWAEDAAGNRTVDSMNIFIINDLGINTEKQSAFSIFPNPASDVITIKNNSGIPTQAKLYDLTGRALQNIAIENNTTRINIQSYPNGLYFLKLNNSEVIKIRISQNSN
jgi:hypothetical protein